MKRMLVVAALLASCAHEPPRPPAPTPPPATAMRPPPTPPPPSILHHADEGTYHVSARGSDVMHGHFTLRSDGSFEDESTIALGGQKVTTTLTLETEGGRWKTLRVASPARTIEVRHEHGEAITTADGKSVSAKIPDDVPIFDGKSLALLGDLLTRYDLARGGVQKLPVYLAGLSVLDMSVERQEVVRRPVAGRDQAFARWSVDLKGLSTTAYLDEAGRVVALLVPQQDAAIVRDGYDALAVVEGPADPTLSQPKFAVVKETLRVPMRDQIALATDVYRPKTDDRVPLVLIRTPYSRAMMELDGRWWAARGYACAIQDVRGRFDSEGTWEPFVHEADDGYDTIEHLAKLPFSTGKVGMIGGSYLGWVQWWAASRHPPHLATIIPNVAPPDPFFNVPYEYGVFFMGGAIWWADILETRATADLSGAAMAKVGELRFGDVGATLPVVDLDKKVLGKENPYWRAWIDHPTEDAYWKRASFRDALPKIAIPVFHQSGWFDGDGIGTKLNYSGVAKGRALQKLVIGPWGHTDRATRTVGDRDFGPQALVDLPREYLRWMDRWLKGVDNGIDKEPLVRLFVMGDNKWVTGQKYPLEQTRMTKWYLASDGDAVGSAGNGRLVPSDKELGQAQSDHYTYDPADPTPYPEFFEKPEQAKGSTVAAEELRKQAHARHAEVLATRKDILVYTSAPLTSPLTIVGPVSAVLVASSSAKDTDWFVSLVDVDAEGKLDKLVQGKLRARFRDSTSRPSLLVPGKPYTFTLDLWHTGVTIPTGHRLRVEVASASLPLFSRNLNTGGANEKETASVPAKQTVFHGGKQRSYVLLPVLPQ